ncbi:FAD-binding oxidoreductase [Ornithinimicrobium faecis]|uniref:FAD-binding oxidoreductase n=1 Tax=Ornithinimicrobium faecis TaxID=2934158 RepID=A0ABY4YYE3_9MICO|nr:FAD-binding oxidoreductase [Ornithinimicrobium sp. HY1793]USQ81275.1 FAD-binding oxidoreductase [Ornithinimicrobium sp. HY1793]
MAVADVVVIGAGVIGSSTALELHRAGFSVVVVDKAGGAGHGSSSASSAIVRFNYSTFDGVATAWESRACWEAWHDHVGVEDPAGMASFVRTGMVMLDAPILPREPIVDLFTAVGVPHELWDSEGLRAGVPGVDVGKHWPPKSIEDPAFFADSTATVGGIYTPDAGYVDDPQLAAQNLAFAAASRGVDFRFRSTVAAVLQSGDRVSGVRLSDGTVISAPVVVNVGGPWSGAINDLAGVGPEFTVGVRPMRQEVHQLPAPEGLLTTIIGDVDLGTYIRPTKGPFVLVGGTEPECDPFEWIDDPERADPRPTRARFEAQALRAARRLPGLQVPNAPAGIAGVYDVADDWTPIYDRTDLDGYYVAMGTSGNQFKNAPMAGRFMAALVSGVENGHDHDGTPLTHLCQHTGHSINLGAFSRKRPINEHSSNTVMG